jgi:hypothetical protein
VVNRTKKVAVFIQMPSVMFQTSLDRTPERNNVLPRGLGTRQICTESRELPINDICQRAPQKEQQGCSLAAIQVQAVSLGHHKPTSDTRVASLASSLVRTYSSQITDHTQLRRCTEITDNLMPSIPASITPHPHTI